MHDPLAEACKALEHSTAPAPFPATGWIWARLDGRGFSKQTRHLRKPYDLRLAQSMDAVARHLMDDLIPVLAYHQSDEISLFWAADLRDLPFSGRPEKFLSVLAASASSALMRALDRAGLSEMADGLPHMDARVRHVDTIEAAGMQLAWRAQDARRNAIQGLAQRHFAQATLQHQDLHVLRKRLTEAGAPFGDMPPAYRNGTLYTRHSHTRVLAEDERMAIPLPHRPAPGLAVQRRVVHARTDVLPSNPQYATQLLAQAYQEAYDHQQARISTRAVPAQG